MLGETGLMTTEESAAAVAGLKGITADIRKRWNLLLRKVLKMYTSRWNSCSPERSVKPEKKYTAAAAVTTRLRLISNLFLRASILELKTEVKLDLFDLLIQHQARNIRISFFRAIHTCRWPCLHRSDCGWDAYAESLVDDMEMLSMQPTRLPIRIRLAVVQDMALHFPYNVNAQPNYCALKH